MSVFAARHNYTDDLCRLDDWMASANRCYYELGMPFYDFTTAPEICQIFGEVIAAWCVDTWKKIGQPQPFCLIELGPGLGTLMADIVCTLMKVVPDCLEKIQIHLIEQSKNLQHQQAEALGSFGIIEVYWHENFQNIPDLPFILIGNEFLDALPIRQFLKCNRSWYERFIRQSCPLWVSMDKMPPPYVMGSYSNDGIIEYCPPQENLLKCLAKRMLKNKGVALFFDYGSVLPVTGGTLQAIYRGQFSDPFVNIGESDLTAHVNFSWLKEVAAEQGLIVYGPVPQSDFLAQLGIYNRLEMLIKHNPFREQEFSDSVSRLVAPEKMGHLFKVIAFSGRDNLNIAGLLKYK